MAWAQSAHNYPNKPIHIIVPFTAGGTTDILARSFGQKMTELKARIIELGQELGGGKHEELAAAIRNDAAIFDETIKRSNIKVDQN